MSIKLSIDGTEVLAREGASVLDAALEAGIFIPHLCKHPNLEAAGGCRLCVVEIEGREEIVPSCMTKAADGMKALTKSARAEAVRKMAMELILATHPADCTGCPKYGKCELQSMYQYMGVSAARWKTRSRPVPTDSSNPLIEHLFTRCIRCGRCVRACRDLRGVKVLDFQKTKDGVRIGTDKGVSLSEAGCRFCGACIQVCPTGSIMDARADAHADTDTDTNTDINTVVPCRSTCPAHIDIPRYIRYIKEGDFDRAAAVIREKVPFPETLGNICSHACEEKCKRNALNAPLSICRLKQAAAQNDHKQWKKRLKRAVPTGKRAAVVGAGPAGLTAAYYLAGKGHEVTVFEENERAGGQGRYGIPAYRLPDDVLDREIADILEAGVCLKLNTRISSPETLLDQGFSAVLVAVGTHQGTKLPIPGNDLPQVYVNTDFLKRARTKSPVPTGERVMVLGGGNVAYDCARTAVRLGAKEVHIACLENEQQMTASPEEIEEGREEGIILHAAHSFLGIAGTKQVEGVKLQKVKSFSFDEQRKAVIELEEGSQELIPVDSVIFAVGQKPKGTEEMGLKLTHGPYLWTDGQGRTSREGIFAAGDVVTGTQSVIAAIAAGRSCAEEIDRYLGGDGDISETLLDEEPASPYLGRMEGFASLQRKKPKTADSSERIQGFGLVEQALCRKEAQEEAARCLQCDLRLQLGTPKLWTEYS